jgi:hypothetical protein
LIKKTKVESQLSTKLRGACGRDVNGIETLAGTTACSAVANLSSWEIVGLLERAVVFTTIYRLVAAGFNALMWKMDGAVDP